jgi:hypothetical protein
VPHTRRCGACILRAFFLCALKWPSAIEAGRQSPQKEMAPARGGLLGPWRLCLGAQKHRQTIQSINPYFQDTHLGVPACRGLSAGFKSCSGKAARTKVPSGAAG